MTRRDASVPRRKADSSPRRSKLLDGGLWLLTSNVGAKLVSAVAAVMAIRMLGVHQTGIQAAILSVHAAVGVLASMNAADGVTHYVSAATREGLGRQLAIYLAFRKVVMVMAMVSGLLIAALSPFLMHRIFGMDDAWPYLAISAPAMFFGAASALQPALLNALGHFKSTATLAIISGLLQSLLIVGLVWIGGLFGYCVALAVSSVATYVIGVLWLRRTLRSHPASAPAIPRREIWAMLKDYCVPSFAASSVIGVYSVFALSYLARHDGSAASGIVSGAGRFTSPLLFVSASFAAVALPLLTGSIRGASIHGRPRKLVLDHLGVVLAASIVVGIPVMALASPLMRLLGEGFSGSGNVLRVLVVATTLQIIAQVGLNVLAAQRRMRTTFLIILVASAIAAIATMVLIRRWGTVGFAAATAALWLLVAVGTFLAWATQRYAGQDSVLKSAKVRRPD